MKIKILVSMSSATDNSHGMLQAGETVDLDEKTAKYLVSIGNAQFVEQPAVKVTNPPRGKSKPAAVKKG